MEININYPDSEEGQDQLRRLVAMVHADCTDRSIRNLSLTYEKKCILIKKIIDAYQPLHKAPL